MVAYVLTDYYNLPQRTLNWGVVNLARQVDSLAQAECPEAAEVTVRLYGGWYDDSGLTKDGTRIAQQIRSQFPMAVRGVGGGIHRIDCEMASSLLGARDEVFPLTLRRRRGLSALDRVLPPKGCVDTVNCTVPSVLKWSRKGCPAVGCSVRGSDAFFCRQQKLVDVLLCCDLLTLGARGELARIFVVSEDDDFVPGLVQSGATGAKVWHVRTKPEKARAYDLLLRGHGVRIVYLA